MEEKYGEIEELNICENMSEHLQGKFLMTIFKINLQQKNEYNYDLIKNLARKYLCKI